LQKWNIKAVSFGISSHTTAFNFI